MDIESIQTHLVKRPIEAHPIDGDKRGLSSTEKREIIARREATEKTTDRESLKPEDREFVRLKDRVKDIIVQLRSRLNRKVHMEIDSESERFIVKILDAETEELIKQIPTEEFLAIYKRLEDIQGILFNKEI